MYNVEDYLPDFFESLEAQTVGIENLEIVLVDDGSTDSSATIAQEFAARHPTVVKVIRKTNGGQASARNLGLEHATGEWVTFPDPDDRISPTYFSDVATLIRDHGRYAAMFTARILLWFEGNDRHARIEDKHALAGRFRKGTRLVDLSLEPQVIQAHVTTGFFRLDVIQENQLKFRETLRLRFEDGNFVSRYLLVSKTTWVGLVATAEYLYRQRADSSSLVQSSATRVEKYVDTIRFGYLDVVDAAGGVIPRWAQMLILYDLLWLFRSSQTPAVRRASFSEQVYEDIEHLIRRISQFLDDESIWSFRAMPVSDWMKDALLLFKGGTNHGPVYLGQVDSARGLLSITYRYRGNVPSESVIVRGRPCVPRYGKDWALEFAGHPVVIQRTIWVAADSSIELMLDGHVVPLLVRGGPMQLVPAPPNEIDRRISESVARALSVTDRPFHRRLRRRLGLVLREAGAAVLRRVRLREALRRVRFAWSAVPLFTRKYRRAWVFIDRDVDANDSAEILYKWVVQNRPEVNAWFVIRRGTKDWNRLAAEGARLIDYDSPEFVRVLLSAEHVASSHADRFITEPFPKRWGRYSWSFTFLQHGVIKGDISHWLNPKDISTFVVSTKAEYDYIVGCSAFRHGSKEVRLAGLPRFDALLRQDAEVDPQERNRILVMPTWRDYLVGSMQATSRERGRVDSFGETEYAQNLTRFLYDPALSATCEALNLRVTFMPHPNMHMYLADFDLPSYVDIVSYDDVDVREMIARARVLVTDYSSIAFNMAYIRRPIVYFQFDRDEYLRGHTERPGYFSYERDGFGPVVSTACEAAKAVADAVAGQADPVYALRMKEAFPVRDGNNCRRVFEAMEDSRSPAPPTARCEHAAEDSWA